MKVAGRIIPSALICLSVLATLLWSKLLFHSAVEVFSICVALGIFALTQFGILSAQNRFLAALGPLYLGVAVIDMLHMLSYQGMGVIPNSDANMATQFWLAARYLEVVGLILVFLLGKSHANFRYLFTSGILLYCAVSIGLIANGYWPVAFINGTGLTDYKVYSEYALIAGLLIASVAVYQRRRQLKGHVSKAILVTLALTAGAELAFTFYVDVFDLSNIVGHFFKLISFMVLCELILREGMFEANQKLSKLVSAKLSQGDLLNIPMMREEAIPVAVMGADYSLKNATPAFQKLLGSKDKETCNAMLREAFNAGQSSKPSCIDPNSLQPRALKVAGRHLELRLMPLTPDNGNEALYSATLLDRSELERTRSLLERTREQNEGLLKAARSVQWEFDARSHQFIWVSKNVHQVLGLSEGAFLSCSFGHLGQRIPSDPKKLLECAPPTSVDRDPEFDFTTPDGRALRLREALTHHRFDEGAFILGGCFFDVTDAWQDKNNAETKAKHLRDKLTQFADERRRLTRELNTRTVLDDAEPIPHFIVNDRLLIEAGSAKALEVYQSKAKPLEGRPFILVVHKDCLTECYDHFRHAFANGRDEKYLTLKTATGEPREVIIASSVIESEIREREAGPGSRHVMSMIHDVTDHAIQLRDTATIETVRSGRDNLLAIKNALPDGFVIHGPTGRILDANRKACDLLGLSLDELLTSYVQNFEVGASEADLIRLWARMDEGQDIRVEGKHRRSDGTTYPTEISVCKLSDADETYLAIFRDVSDHAAQKAAIQEREEFTNSLLKWASDGVYAVDTDGICTFANNSCVRLLGFDNPNQIIGENMHSLVHHTHTNGDAYPFSDCPVNQCLKRVCEMTARQETFWRKDGSPLTVEVRAHSTVDEEGRISGAVVSFNDVSERIKQETILRKLASKDELTGLLNRKTFVDSMIRLLSKAQVGNAALLFMDLDKFKPVNDTYGHEAGDVVLQEVAKRLKASLRSEDMLARYGGDEFVVLVLGADAPYAAERAANTIRHKISQPIDFEDKELVVGCSIGIAVFDGQSHDELIIEADQAMFADKNSGHLR